MNIPLLPGILGSLKEGYTESYINFPVAIVIPQKGFFHSAWFFFHFMIQVSLEFKNVVHVGEGPSVSYAASPYARYYLTVSTLISWRHITALFACVLNINGSLEDSKASSISVRVARVLFPKEVTLEEEYAIQGSRQEYEDSAWTIRKTRAVGTSHEPRTYLIALPLERSIPANDDNHEP
ncbi:hypothetical protein EI94DRAFT_1704988 [Lactarius quietus]|nr:hypothetical protein EI94DRAFT_1704988 [Lactarius quietus]